MKSSGRFSRRSTRLAAVSGAAGRALDWCRSFLAAVPERHEPVCLEPLEDRWLLAAFTIYDNNMALRGDNFQSHNQKIAWTANGIFRSGDLQSWPNGSDNVVIQRSTNGGVSWQNVFDTGVHRDDLKPPTVEADPFGNVYVIYPDSGKTRFLKFSASNNYASPVVNKSHSQATSASKFASAYDPGRNRIYHATQTGYLYTFDTSGNVVRGQQLFTTGSTGSRPSYPHLFVDEFGVIHYALTVADDGDDIPYETIRYLKSLDGGSTWRAMNGAAVSVPTTSNPNGPSTMINWSSEVSDNTWLANMHAKDGKVHFTFENRNDGLMRYIRFDEATGVREIDRTSLAGGSYSIRSEAASFASDTSNSTGALYVVGEQDGHRLVALVSYDNGETWQDYAQSGYFGTINAPGLARSVTPDAKVIGGAATDDPYWATVNHIELPAAQPTTTIAYWDGGGSNGAWGTDANWVGNVEPGFNNQLAVAIGANESTGYFGTMRIGGNRTVRALIFGARADSDVSLRLHQSSGNARTLTFESDVPGGSAEINVHHDATGDIDIGGGVSDGNVILDDPLRVNHDGSGILWISRPISGPYDITKLGTGELALSGDNSGFSGGLLVQQGKLALSGSQSENGEPDVYVASGATLSLGSGFVGGTATIGNLTGAGLVDPQFGSGSGTRTLRVNQTSDGTFWGKLNDATSGGRVLALKKNGAGTLTLVGTASTYSGGTEIYQGVLRISADGSLGASGGDVAFTSGGSGILMNYNSTVTFNSGRWMILNGNGAFQAGWGKNMTIAGKITGAGEARIKSDSNPGFVIFSNTGNNYAGDTVVESGGKLQLGAGNVLPDATTVRLDGTLDLNGKSDAIQSLELYDEAVLSGAGTLTLVNSGAWGIQNTDGAGNRTVPWNIVLGSQASATNNLDFGCQTAGDTLTLNGVISSPSGYGLDVWPAASTVVLGKANTYAGLTQVWGTLRLNTSNAIKAGNDVALQAGTLDLNGKNQTLGSLTGSGRVLTGGGVLSLGSGNKSFHFSGAVSESGSLKKTGSGTLMLSGANTHTWGTVVEQGFLGGFGSLDSDLAVQAGAGLAFVVTDPGGQADTDWSVLDVDGRLILPSVLKIKVDSQAAGTFPETGGAMTVVSATGGVSGLGTVNFDLANFTGTGNFTAKVVANDLVVEYHPGIPNQPPTVDSLSDAPDPAPQGDLLTLTAAASDSDGTVAKVEFFRDANGDGVGQAGEKLGQDTSPAGGWTWTGGVTWAQGGHTYLARAIDNKGAASGFRAVEGTVTQGFEGLAVEIGAGQAAALTFTDADGTKVTVRMIGGTAVVLLAGTDLTPTPGRGGASVAGVPTAAGEDIALAHVQLQTGGATAMLMIAGYGGDGRVSVDKISGSVLLGMLNARSADLTGEGILLAGDGAIRTLYLGNLLNGADIAAPGAVTGSVTVMAGQIGANSDMTFGSPLGLLSISGWAGPGVLTAPSAGTVMSRGDFGADVNLTTAGAAGYSANVFYCLGSLDGADLAFAGWAGTIMANAWNMGSLTADRAGTVLIRGDMGASVTLTGQNLAGTSLNRLYAMGGVTSPTIAMTGSATTVMAGTWSAGQFTARHVGTFMSRGGFTGNVTLTGQNRAGSSLNVLYVLGEMNGGLVRTRGGIGTAMIGSMRDSGVYACVLDGVAGMPGAGATAGEYFAAPPAGMQTPAIRMLMISRAAGVFANSVVAAPSMGTVILRGVATDNGDAPFGLVADTGITMLTRYRDGAAPSTARNVDAGLVDTLPAEDDFKISVI